MTCRHRDGDPECSTKNPAQMRERARAMSRAWDTPATPDSENYDIIRNEIIGPHLVLEVQYPNCEKCAYEGRKVLVLLNVNLSAALRWKRIDPHFRNPQDSREQDPRSAPAPSARFPASNGGWEDARAFARMKIPG